MVTSVNKFKLLCIETYYSPTTLVPGVVLIPLRIATKLSMTKSESILEN